MRNGSAASAKWPRLNLCAQAILLAELLGMLIILLARMVYPETQGMVVLGNDFRVFLAAGQLALDGTPADAYDLARIFSVMQASDPTIGEALPWFGWFYPPTFLLVAECLARLPVWLAYVLFVGGSLLAYLLTLRNAADRLPLFWISVAFPPVVVAAYNGQNAFLSAALAGTALIVLDRRPVIAGICIGLLAIKPQLAILFPVALAFGKRWQAFASAALTVLTFCGLSYLILGWSAFTGFLDGLSHAREFILHPDWPLTKMPTVFIAGLSAGVGADAANAMQIVASITAAAVVAWAWQQQWPEAIRNSILILATLTAVPHLFNYDLTWLGLPFAWMAVQGVRDGWLRGERTTLVCAWLSPLVLENVAKLIGPNLGVLVPIVLLGFLVQRGRKLAPNRGPNRGQLCHLDGAAIRRRRKL